MNFTLIVWNYYLLLMVSLITFLKYFNFPKLYFLKIYKEASQRGVTRNKQLSNLSKFNFYQKLKKNTNLMSKLHSLTISKLQLSLPFSKDLFYQLLIPKDMYIERSENSLKNLSNSINYWKILPKNPLIKLTVKKFNIFLKILKKIKFKWSVWN